MNIKKWNKKIIMYFIIIIFLLVFNNNNSYAASSIQEELTDKIPIKVTVIGDLTEEQQIFTYQIIPDENNPEGAVNEPSIIEVPVNKNDNQIGDNRYVKNVDIDFSTASYSNIGIYAYTIKEVNISNKKQFEIQENEYIVYVVVRTEGGNYVPSVHRYVYDVKNNTKEDSLSFIHTQMTYLKLEMFTDGKKADNSEYFKLNVRIFGNSGSKYAIIGQDPIVLYNNERIATIDEFEITGDNNSFDIYLKNGQKVYIGIKNSAGEIIYQIPVGTYINITEEGARKYQTFINGDEGKKTRGFYLTGNEENNTIQVVNYADYDVAITGVFINILPYVIISITVIIFLIMYIYKKNKDKKDDEDD